MDGLTVKAREWLEHLDERGYRGLVIVHGRSVAPALLASLLSGREVLVLASSSRRGSWKWTGWRVESPARVQRLLGGEYDAVIVDVEPLLLPNLLAAVAEMVRAPGVLVIVADCPWQWDPGGWLGSGGYARYLEYSLDSMSALLRLDLCGGRVVESRLPPVRGEKPWPPGPPRLDDREYLMVPRVLRELVATRDQGEALRAAWRFARGGYRTLLFTGDRGRGKSAALGLALALLTLRKDVGFVTVTAPSLESVQSLFRMLVAALRKAGINHRVLAKGDVVYGVRGPWFHVRFHTLEEVYEPGGLLVIDEAAAVGPHRLRMLARKARRLMAATTIHGYEGSGRTLLHMVESILPQPMIRVELKTPVRYPPGDPLEDWLYETFVLRRLLGDERYEPLLPVECVSMNGWRLASDPWLARLAYEVLSEAHYRNEPDDLALMLDSPYYRVYILRDSRGVPIAVAEVSLEWLAPRERRMLTSITGLWGYRVARIVRIAVRTELQGRGFGSRLLRCVEHGVSVLGGEVVGAVYSRGVVTRFWLANGYRVVYISPRFNKATGEKNIAVAKSISAPLSAIAELEYNMRLRLLIAGQSVYRDLPAEVLVDMLRVEPLLSTVPPLGLTEWQERVLDSFLRGELDHEAAWDAVWASVVSILARRGLRLEDKEAVALVARLVQGKPLSEVAALLGVDRAEAARIVDSAARRLVRAELERLG